MLMLLQLANQGLLLNCRNWEPRHSIPSFASPRSHHARDAQASHTGQLLSVFRYELSTV